MAVHTHQKKVNRQVRRLLPAFGMMALLVGVFSLLIGLGYLSPPQAGEGASPQPEQQPMLQQTDAPVETPTPVRRTPRPYATRSRISGYALRPQPELLAWGVDTVKPEAQLRRCRFTDGSGLLLRDYSFGLPVPESAAVGEDYFADAVFIGNSLEQGFMIYSGLTTADMFATQSINVVNIFSEKVINVGGGSFISIMDAVARGTYGKVFVMLGLNEISFRPADFTRQYGRVVDALREMQPDADIYLQSMTPVTKRQSQSGSVFNNQRIAEYNELIRGLAEEKRVHYLHIYESLADEEGNLPAGSSADGIHPYSKYYKQWYEYLLTHTAVEVRK